MSFGVNTPNFVTARQSGIHSGFTSYRSLEKFPNKSRADRLLTEEPSKVVGNQNDSSFQLLNSSPR